jgi:hypothetical protein
VDAARNVYIDGYINVIDVVCSCVAFVGFKRASKSNDAVWNSFRDHASSAIDRIEANRTNAASAQRTTFILFTHTHDDVISCVLYAYTV